MSSSTDVYVFGDQSIPVVDRLQSLLHIQDNALLTLFLRDAFMAIRQETEALPSTDKAPIVQAENLALLLEAYRHGEPHAALESCFLCIYEIGYYIHYVSRSNKQHPPTASSLFLGVCTGALAAAAISCSVNLFEVVKLGVQAVIVAFRQGMYVRKRAELLGYSTSESWSVIIPEKKGDTTEILEKFTSEKNLPTALQPYISAIGPTFTTISGPPAILKQVQSLPAFAGKKWHPASIYGPYHSPHYSKVDVDNFIHVALKDIEFLNNEVLTRVFSASGEAVKATSFKELLDNVLRGALADQIRMDYVVDGLWNLASAEGDNVTIIPINSQAAPGLAEALSKKGATTRVQQSLESSFSQPSASGDRNKIAIVGFSGRFPEADSLDEFWDLISQGLDVHKTVPEDRFPRDHYDPTGQRKNTSQVQYGCWLKNAGHFDNQFFHMSPKEAVQTDPAQRLALLTAYEALDMAGFVPDRTPSTQRHRVGVYYGTTSNDWGEVNSAQMIDTYYIPGANRAFIPGRVNYFFKFTGPSIAVDTACSSSLAAINLAVTALRNGDCDSAIAGGTNVLTNPDNFAGLDRGHFLSRTGNCKAFDDGADGYCRADGVGTLVLKRLPDALADKDPIFGVLQGAQTNHSAESVSITRPLAGAQEYLFKKLLSETGIYPHDVSYVEMHGTGTQAGDAVEMRSVLNAFAPDHSRSKTQRHLYLGSVKANVGHAESASGVIAVIKVLLMMQKNKIPPHCGIKSKINHSFPTDLDQRGVHIARKQSVSWPRPVNGYRRVLINNFSAAGGNTSLLLEDGPVAVSALDHHLHPPTDPRTGHIVAVSARSRKALEENLRSLEAFLAGSFAPDGELLSQLSYTTTARRMHHSYRTAFVANSVDDLRRSLFAAATTTSEIQAVSSTLSPKVGFLFTGQGALETAMARGYYTNIASFRVDIDELDGVGRRLAFPSILPLVDGSIPAENLSAIVVQLGTCIVQMALARLWIRLGISPDYVMGHSLGEYAALQVAGVLSFHDTIYLCGHRAALLEKKCTANTHGMVAVRASAEALHTYLTPAVEVACFNGEQDAVLSGPNDAVDEICATLEQQGFRFHALEVSLAFHSSQVDPILDDLEALASHITFHNSSLPIVSTLSGEVVRPGDIGPHYIRRHCREPVNFLGAVQTARDAGLLNSKTGVCIEIGAHPILSRMVKAVTGQETRCFASLRRKEDCFRTLADSVTALYLAGLPIRWDEYHSDFAACQKVLALPRYSWQLANYWMAYRYSWCLTKGDAPDETPVVAAPVSKPIRLSDSVHNIIQKTLDDSKSILVIESDMHDPALLMVAKNHRVNGLTMAPSTLFADMVFTMANYLLEKRGLDIKAYFPAVNHMAVEKALIVNNTGPQLFRASLEVDWTAMHGAVQIYSVDVSGKKTSLHAVCDVALQDSTLYQESWQSHEYLIERSIAHLKGGDASVHMMRRGMLYKMFSASVQYGPAFQGIQQVWFDSEGLEGTAKVYLPVATDNFVLNPYCCDSLGHLTGFLMNCSDSLDLEDFVYVNHGWSYMHLTEAYQRGVHYQTYVKMRAMGQDDSTYTGDVHVLRDGKIIAICGGVTFRKVPRKVLEMLLPRQSNKTRETKKEVKKEVKPATTSNASAVPITAASTAVPSQPSAAESAAPDLIQKALEIIADEIGVDVAQLTDSTLLGDLGVDSLMSLTILGNFREELDLDIPSAQFYECASVKALKYFIADFAGLGASSAESSAGSEPPSVARSSTPTTTNSSTSRVCEIADETEKPVENIVVPRSTSIVLQGTKHCAKTLFLFPDGAGSATSYVTLPPIAADLRVVGLNSPYLTKPQDFQCALQDITGSYLTEVRRRQPQGPYHLAGWSAGGVSAFDAARQLVAEGEVVASLTLIDSPNPVGLGKLPKRMYDFLEKSGIFGAFEMGEESSASAPPDWLFQHFCVFIEALDRYTPIPFAPGTAPPTTIVWACDGVCKNPDDPRPEPQPDDPRGMTWLLYNRSDFGPNGWDEFLGGVDNIDTCAIDAANHFTMMREPTASRLCAKIREAIGM